MTKRTKYTTKDCNHVGVMVPQHIAIYLTLFAMLKGRTKSNLIRSMVNEGYTHLLSEHSLESIIEQLTVKYQLDWENLKSRFDFNGDLDLVFLDFLHDTTTQLIGKNISAEIIDEIIRNIKI